MALFGNKNNQTNGDGAEMSFLDHIEVLRWHLVRSALVVVVLAVGMFAYSDVLYNDIIFAPQDPNFVTFRYLCKLADYMRQYINVDDALCVTKANYTFINTDMSGQFTSLIYVCLVAAIIVAFPYIFWEVWRFIKPALKEQELRTARGVVFYCSILFFAGILFGYYIVSPLAANFLGNFQVSDKIANQIDFNSFISLITVTTLVTGLVFELPVVAYILSRLGLVTPDFMRRYRRHSIVVILIVAAVITPSPDVVSQILVSVPLYILYEVSILVSARVVKQQAAPQTS